MFLFFSKLLPLLVYPLGLATLILLLGLIIGWKRPYFTLFPMGIALLVLFIASNAWVSSRLVQSLEWQHLPDGELPQAEAIILLGGSTQAPIPPRQTIEITEAGDRVFYAAHLYQQEKAPLIIATGGQISWLGKEQPEATNMKQLLVKMGVPESDIVEETQALNTHDNAVYTKEILEANGIEQSLLVTSASHMPRSMLTFQKQEIDVIAAPTDFTITQQHWEQLQATPQSTVINFLPNVEHLKNTTEALKEYIGIVVYWLRGWI